MTTVTIADSTYRQLEAKAKARSLTVEAYLTAIAAEEDSARQLAALESFAAGMAKWTATLPPGHTVDDSRGSIYEGRGE